MNETTELIMKQLNQKKVHASTHELGGDDEIDALKLKNIAKVISGPDGTVISVTKFGAKGDGIADDTAAIQTAIDSVSGGTIFFPLGTYIISAPIKIKRGITLKGATTFDDSTLTSSSTIKLKNGANCSMVQTPSAVSGAGATHYMAIENLRFDGNKANQTVEKEAIQFWGAWVGSWIRDVAIMNTFGTALSFKNGTDVEVSHVWVLGCDTSGYAVEFNRGITVGQMSGLVTMRSIYVEQTTNGTKPASVTPSVYGKAIWAYALVSLQATEIHTEVNITSIDIQYCNAVNIGTLSASSVGDPARESAGIRFMDTNTKMCVISELYVSNQSANYKLVMPTSGVTSNEIVTVPFGQGFLMNYVYSNFGYSDYILPQSTKVTNQMKIVANGGASPQGLNIVTSTSTPTNYHYMYGNGDHLTLGTNYGKATETDLMVLNSGAGGAGSSSGDNIALNAAMYLKDRADAGSLGTGAIFTIGNNPVISKGSNAFQNLTTVRTGSGAPSTSSDFIGQDYVDTTSKLAYKATQKGTGATDWTSLASSVSSSSSVYSPSGVPFKVAVSDTGVASYTFNGLAYDLFDRSDSATTLTSAVVGGAWTAVTGTWGTLTNEAYCVSNNSSDLAKLGNVGNANVSVSCAMKGVFVGGANVLRPCLVFKYIDSSNYLYIRPDTSAITLEDAATGTLGPSYSYTFADNTYYTFKVTVVGAIITVYINNVLIFTYTMTGTVLTKYGVNAGVGLRLSKTGAPAGAAKWNNLIVE